MTKSAWQRTGAFVGTVTTVALVAKTMSPRPSARAIEEFGKSFSNSIQAMTGGTYEEVVNYQRARPLSLPYFWAGIYYRALSLFPQVPTPFQLETWEEAACRIYDFAPATWEDAEYLAELVHQLKCECGTDGI